MRVKRGRIAIGDGIVFALEHEKRGSPRWTSPSSFSSKLVEHLAWNRVHDPVDQMLG